MKEGEVMSQDLNHIFKGLGRNVQGEFYPYANVKHSIRKRDGLIYIRVSDTFRDAPEEVLVSLGRMLMAKLNRKKVDERDRGLYLRYVSSGELQEKASKILAERKRRVRIVRGHYRDLNKSFERVNEEYFRSCVKKPVLTWSMRRAKRTLGKYDVERDIVFISRVLDSLKVPEALLDFIMYHELLHKKHGIGQGERRRIHTAAFRRDEKKFRDYEKMKELMERVAKMR